MSAVKLPKSTPDQVAVPQKPTHEAGLIVGDSASLIAFAKLSSVGVLLAFFRILLTAVLLIRRTPGAFLLSIAALALCGFFLKDGAGHPITQAPHQWLSLPHLHRELLFAFDFHEFFSKFFFLLPITVYFLVSEFFSATATLIGVARRAGLSRAGETLPNGRGAFASDPLASVVGAALGTSTVTAFC